ncbi:MAG: hypothetical protein P4L53_26900 [Candidatus Obscuribacterales bacterium]|nr:hypothetical protein [Candidatus Obscuribacterales bacterium]
MKDSLKIMNKHAKQVEVVNALRMKLTTLRKQQIDLDSQPTSLEEESPAATRLANLKLEVEVAQRELVDALYIARELEIEWKIVGMDSNNLTPRQRIGSLVAMIDSTEAYMSKYDKFIQNPDEAYQSAPCLIEQSKNQLSKLRFLLQELKKDSPQ